AEDILHELDSLGTRTGTVSSYSYSIDPGSAADTLGVSLDLVKYGYKDSLAADVGGLAGVDVPLVPLSMRLSSYFGKRDVNVRTGLSLGLTLDGAGQPALSPGMEVYGEALFRQDVSSAEAKAASYGLLGLSSSADPADDDRTPDVTLGMSVSLDGTTAAERLIQDADLNFTIPAPTDFDGANLGLSTTSTQVLTVGHPSAGRNDWTWSDPDIEVFDTVEMGQILGKLSDLSRWLSANTCASASNADPQFRETFGGLLDQNVSDNQSRF
ncbi:MAG: hypothetical protein M0P13_00670, partial [Fibrobacteraceae bacterium]|nr:hypothetical protein [Fibrobacteraceae bacterium]